MHIPKVFTNSGLWSPANVSVVDGEYGAIDNEGQYDKSKTRNLPAA